MPDDATTESFIPVRVGLVWLAFAAREVQEIAGARAWMPAPHATPLLPGMLAWRGRAVGVLDLSVLAGTGEPLDRRRPRRRTVIALGGDCALAMPVDVVWEVQEVDATRVRPVTSSSVGSASTEVLLFDAFAPVVDLAALVAMVLGAAPEAGQS